MGIAFAYLLLIIEIAFYFGFGLWNLKNASSWSKKISKKDNSKLKIFLIITGLWITGRSIILLYQFLTNWVF